MSESKIVLISFPRCIRSGEVSDKRVRHFHQMYASHVDLIPTVTVLSQTPDTRPPIPPPQILPAQRSLPNGRLKSFACKYLTINDLKQFTKKSVLLRGGKLHSRGGQRAGRD